MIISLHLSIAINAIFYTKYSDPTYSIILIINWLSCLLPEYVSVKSNNIAILTNVEIRYIIILTNVEKNTGGML